MSANRQRRYDPLAVLSYIASYQGQHRHRTPSQRRIQRALEISAPSVVHNLLHRLERRGLISITTYGQGHAAEISLTESGQTTARTWRQPDGADDDRGDETEQRTA